MSWHHPSPWAICKEGAFITTSFCCVSTVLCVFRCLSFMSVPSGTFIHVFVCSFQNSNKNWMQWMSNCVCVCVCVDWCLVCWLMPSYLLVIFLLYNYVFSNVPFCVHAEGVSSCAEPCCCSVCCRQRFPAAGSSPSTSRCQTRLRLRAPLRCSEVDGEYQPVLSCPVSVLW